MTRFLAGALACFLMLTGAFLIWQSHAEQNSSLLEAPLARPAQPLMIEAESEELKAPEASPKAASKSAFRGADKNKDGRIQSEELLSPRGNPLPSSTAITTAHCRSRNGR